MYAGWKGALGSQAIPYDQIFILTLPAFQWMRVDYPAAHPRHALSCNAVGGSQIITIGGLNSASNDSGTAQIYESVFNDPDPFTQGLAIFDMTTLNFTDKYTANASPYIQSDMVKSYYAQK